MRRFPEDYWLIKKKANQILRGFKTRANNADGKHPTYANINCEIDNNSLFYFWYYQEYRKLSLIYPDETLVVDRINNLGPYRLDNLQLMTISANEIKKAEDHAIEYCGRIPTKIEKYCNGCKSILNRGEFNVDNREVDQLHTHCRSCAAETKRRGRKK